MTDDAKGLAERRLTKPAQVGGTIFNVGIKERLVIERAQRECRYQNETIQTRLRSAKFKRFMAAMRKR